MRFKNSETIKIFKANYGSVITDLMNSFKIFAFQEYFQETDISCIKCDAEDSPHVEASLLLMILLPLVLCCTVALWLG